MPESSAMRLLLPLSPLSFQELLEPQGDLFRCSLSSIVEARIVYATPRIGYQEGH